MQNPPLAKCTNPQKSKPKSRLSKRQRQRRRNKQKLVINNQNKSPSHFSSRRIGSQIQNGADIWRKAYENAVRWHEEHQSNFWRHAAENLQRENQMLRQQLISNGVAKPKEDFYETSGSDDEEVKKEAIYMKEETEKENDEIDAQYLEFLQVTFKHREEMRLKRQAEDLQVVDNPTDVPEKIV